MSLQIVRIPNKIFLTPKKKNNANKPETKEFASSLNIMTVRVLSYLSF
jgi:hypothetical protein